MLNRIREQTGTAGLVMAVIALVFALVGGAYAASGGLTGKQKKEVTKIAKQYAGKPGEKGATGSVGPQGSKGDTGAQGSVGKEGKEGKEGEDGEDGDEGDEGEQGPPGPEGSPWTAGGTLPPGATETGVWSFNGTEADTEGIAVPISFPIPFPFLVKGENAHFGEAEEGGAFEEHGPCPGETAAKPKAAPGQLCVYKSENEGLVGATFVEITRLAGGEGALPPGAALNFTPTAAVAHGIGTYAITSCTEKVVAGVGKNECA